LQVKLNVSTQEIDLKTHLILISSVFLLFVLVIPGYLRAYKVHGDSDAPSLVTGDRILVSFLSYDIRLPYIHHPAFRFRDPRPGDFILFKTNSGQIVFKRIVAGPGARISMKQNHLFINGRSLIYSKDESMPGRGELGSVLELENGNGWDVYISFTPNADSISEFDEFVVPSNGYYVLGSNRDLSEDSRHYGPVTRDCIMGKVIRKF